MAPQGTGTALPREGGWRSRGSLARRVGTAVGAWCRCPHSPAGGCPGPVPVSGAAGAAAAAGAGQEVTGAAPRLRGSGAGGAAGVGTGDSRALRAPPGQGHPGDSVPEDSVSGWHRGGSDGWHRGDGSE